jgi:hypothetical protein
MHQRLYDDALVPGDPLLKNFAKSFQQDTSFTSYLQFRGTPQTEGGTMMAEPGREEPTNVDSVIVASHETA